MKRVERVLIIDDGSVDQTFLVNCVRSFEKACDIQLSQNFQHALVKIQNERWNCVFVHCNQDPGSAITLLNTTRAMGVNGCIVAITPDGNEILPGLVMTSGACGHMFKSELNATTVGLILRNSMRMALNEQEKTAAFKVLKEQESRLIDAQRIANIGNWEWDGGETVYWSDEIYNILGLEKDHHQATVEQYMRFVHPEDRDQLQRLLDTLGTDNGFNIDHRLIIGQAIKYVNVKGFFTKDENQGTNKLTGTIQDITARKLSEQEVRKAREIAEDSLRVREVFLANMSHEIRTPMNAIIGFTQLLYESKLSPEQKSFVDAINFSGENLLVIINDILDLSKIQSGKMTLERIDFNLTELLKGISNSLRRKAHEKGLQFIYDISEDVCQMVKGDPVRVNQVLTNLISNAIKFSESGFVKLDVTPGKRDGDKFSISFSVQDTGIGIPPEKQSEVFESFVQASSDMTRKYGGTGLGLTIVKSIVDLYGGSISVESAVGQGSTFHVSLPFEKADQDVSEHREEGSTEHTPLHLLKRASILVVEDNHVNQLLVKRVLDKTGCTTDVVANGKEAINSVKAGRYDLILMDIQMPEMDGYAATKYIRTELPAPLSEIPIIAMTAHALPSEVEKCISIGMDDYLSKPFKQELLFSKIVKHLRKSNNLGIIPLHKSEKPEIKRASIDLAALYEICGEDRSFIDDLIRMYEKQTPEFVEKLNVATTGRDWETIHSICHQIRSSYGIVEVQELEAALTEISDIIKRRSSGDFSRLASLVKIVCSLIQTITNDVKRSIRKTG